MSKTVTDFSLPFHVCLVTIVAFVGAWGAGWILTHSPWLQRTRRRVESGRQELSPYSMVYRWGGLVIAGGFFSALMFDNRLAVDSALLTLVFGSLLALGLGLADDWVPLHWLYQLLGQILLAVLLIASGMEITQIDLGGGNVVMFNTFFAWAGSLVTVFWILLVMNALNWIDGADGLMGSIAGVALLVLAYLSWQPPVNQPPLVLLLLMLCGAVLGFLCFNWYPAQLIAGSSGANFIGFLIAALSVYAGAKVATALLVLAIPILDMCSVILTRLRRRKSPFLPDRSHLHHILLSLGFSARCIAGVYLLITSMMGVIALSTRSLEKIWVFLLVGLIFFGVLFWMQWMLTKQKTESVV